MNSRPKILLVGPFPPTTGGVTTFMLRLMSSWLASEFEFLPFTTSRPPKENVVANWGYSAIFRGGVRRILCGLAITLWHIFVFPFALLRQRIDIAQIQASDYQVFWESVIYAIIARSLGCPVILRIGGAFDVFHGRSGKLAKWLISCALRIPNYVIAQSEFARNYIRRAGRTEQILVLPNWSDEAFIDTHLHQREGAPTCLFIAGLEAQRKGVDQVLEAARRLARCDVHFHIVAAVPLLVKRIASMGLSNISVVEGPIAHGNLLQLMRRVGIFLLPSHGEGFPNSLVEAMSAGMASIVTPVGAVPEMVGSGAAIVVPVGDATALAAAIKNVSSSDSLRQQLGEEALHVVRTRYSATGVLPELAKAYRILVQR